MKTKVILISFLSLLLIFNGCLKKESELQQQISTDKAKIQQYFSDNNIVAEESAAGYYYQILVENTSGSTLAQGDIVEIYYSLSLLDGTVVDNYLDESKPPLRFKLGLGKLAPETLDWAIGMIRVGETYRVFIPSYLAYGDYAYVGHFPSNSNLIFEVKVVGIKTEAEIHSSEIDTIQNYITQNSIDNALDYESGLHYIETLEGTGALPSTGSSVDIFYAIKLLDGTVIKAKESEPITISLDDQSILPGLREGVALMKEGGEATLILPSKLAYKESLLILPLGLMDKFYQEERISLNVAPFTPLIFEVGLDKITP